MTKTPMISNMRRLPGTGPTHIVDTNQRKKAG